MTWRPDRHPLPRPVPSRPGPPRPRLPYKIPHRRRPQGRRKVPQGGAGGRREAPATTCVVAVAENWTIGTPPPPDLGDIPERPAEVDDPGGTGDIPDLLSEVTVRSLLETCALLAGMAANPVHVQGLWRFEPGELDMLAPALTRIANRTPVLRAALIRGDWITVALVTGGYTARNVTTWRQASAELERQSHRDTGPDGATPLGTSNVGNGPTPGADARYDPSVRQAGALGSFR